MDAWMKELGHNKVILKTDPEPSTLDLAEKVHDKRKQPTIPRASPKGSNGSLGAATAAPGSS